MWATDGSRGSFNVSNKSHLARVKMGGVCGGGTLEVMEGKINWGRETVEKGKQTRNNGQIETCH